MAKQTVQRLLLDTKPGDVVLRTFERLTGLGVVKLEEIENGRVAATGKGNAAAAKRTPPRD